MTAPALSVEGFVGVAIHWRKDGLYDVQQRDGDTIVDFAYDLGRTGAENAARRMGWPAKPKIDWSHGQPGSVVGWRQPPASEAV